MRNETSIEDRISADDRPLALYAPDPLVVEARTLLPQNSAVLDLGAHNGRNGFYLAAHGHHVDSIEINPDYIEDGRSLARTMGGVALDNIFWLGDMRQLDLKIRYDAAMALTSLQHVAKEESYEVVSTMQQVVKPGGLNIVDAYIADQEQQALKPNYALFKEDELKDIYVADGWEIVKYETTGIMPFSQRAEDGQIRTWVMSQVRLIAREVQREKAKRAILTQASCYHRSDPERAANLTQQANDL